MQSQHVRNCCQFTTCGVGEGFRDVPKQAEGSKGRFAPLPISLQLFAAGCVLLKARCGCETREILVPRGPYLTPRQTEGLLFCRNIPASSRTPWGHPSCQVLSSLDRGSDTAPITFGSGSGREQKAFCTARSGGPLKRYLSLQLSLFVISITLWVVLPFCPFPSQAGGMLHPRRELYLLKAAGG